ncbi:putative hect e3 ubiquitin [Paratrimastix pyriformis]|uniref:Hect e3 ubiquitin n=1 Tax=Paratrimastix pyriformis TaxID=342808 RepID=A0ABQ8UHC6_9EUKA|nr:putative hect e3 ubiquitin [Paratrimastix pyriformis]
MWKESTDPLCIHKFLLADQPTEEMAGNAPSDAELISIPDEKLVAQQFVTNQRWLGETGLETTVGVSLHSAPAPDCLDETKSINDCVAELVSELSPLDTFVRPPTSFSRVFLRRQALLDALANAYARELHRPEDRPETPLGQRSWFAHSKTLLAALASGAPAEQSAAGGLVDWLVRHPLLVSGLLVPLSPAEQQLDCTRRHVSAPGRVQPSHKKRHGRATTAATAEAPAASDEAEAEAATGSRLLEGILDATFSTSSGGSGAISAAQLIDLTRVLTRDLVLRLLAHHRVHAPPLLAAPADASAPTPAAVISPHGPTRDAIVEALRQVLNKFAAAAQATKAAAPWEALLPTITFLASGLACFLDADSDTEEPASEGDEPRRPVPVPHGRPTPEKPAPLAAPGSNRVEPLLAPLLRTVTALEQYMTVRGIHQPEEDWASVLGELGQALVPLDTRTLESPHPYFNQMDDQQALTFPGAVTLSLEFDPQCCTQQNDDWLGVAVTLDGAPVQTIRLTGPHANWPKEKLALPGDALTLTFHSSKGRVEWGYRFRVTPHYVRPAYIPSPLYDAQKSCLGALLKACLAMAGPALPGAAPNELADVESPLLERGLHSIEQLPPSVVAFVRDFVGTSQAPADAPAPPAHVSALLGHLRAAAPAPPMGGAPVDRAVRALFVALLHHSGLLHEAAHIFARLPLDAASADEAAGRLWERIVAAWQVANQSRMTVVRTFQQLQAKAAPGPAAAPAPGGPATAAAAAAAAPGSGDAAGPSMDDVSDEFAQRALFLLRIAPVLAPSRFLCPTPEEPIPRRTHRPHFEKAQQASGLAPAADVAAAAAAAAPAAAGPTAPPHAGAGVPLFRSLSHRSASVTARPGVAAGQSASLPADTTTAAAGTTTTTTAAGTSSGEPMPLVRSTSITERILQQQDGAAFAEDEDQLPSRAVWEHNHDLKSQAAQAQAQATPVQPAQAAVTVFFARACAASGLASSHHLQAARAADPAAPALSPNGCALVVGRLQQAVVAFFGKATLQAAQAERILSHRRRRAPERLTAFRVLRELLEGARPWGLPRPAASPALFSSVSMLDEVLRAVSAVFPEGPGGAAADLKGCLPAHRAQLQAAQQHLVLALTRLLRRATQSVPAGPLAPSRLQDPSPPLPVLLLVPLILARWKPGPADLGILRRARLVTVLDTLAVRLQPGALAEVAAALPTLPAPSAAASAVAVLLQRSATRTGVLEGFLRELALSAASAASAATSDGAPSPPPVTPGPQGSNVASVGAVMQTLAQVAATTERLLSLTVISLALAGAGSEPLARLPSKRPLRSILLEDPRRCSRPGCAEGEEDEEGRSSRDGSAISPTSSESEAPEAGPQPPTESSDEDDQPDGRPQQRPAQPSGPALAEALGRAVSDLVLTALERTLGHLIAAGAPEEGRYPLAQEAAAMEQLALILPLVRQAVEAARGPAQPLDLGRLATMLLELVLHPAAASPRLVQAALKVLRVLLPPMDPAAIHQPPAGWVFPAAAAAPGPRPLRRVVSEELLGLLGATLVGGCQPVRRVGLEPVHLNQALAPDRFAVTLHRDQYHSPQDVRMIIRRALRCSEATATELSREWSRRGQLVMKEGTREECEAIDDVCSEERFVCTVDPVLVSLGPALGAGPQNETNTFIWRSGHVRAALACEVALLLRHIVRTTHTTTTTTAPDATRPARTLGDHIADRVSGVLERLGPLSDELRAALIAEPAAQPSAPATSTSTTSGPAPQALPADLPLALAALAVLGGLPERLRLGGRISSQSSRQQGTLQRAHPTAVMVRVRMDLEQPALPEGPEDPEGAAPAAPQLRQGPPIWAERSQLEPFEEAPLGSAHFAFPSAVIPGLLRLLAPIAPPSSAPTAASTATTTTTSPLGALVKAVTGPGSALMWLHTAQLYALTALVSVMEHSPPTPALGNLLQPLLGALNTLASTDGMDAPASAAQRAQLMARAQEKLLEAQGRHREQATTATEASTTTAAGQQPTPYSLHRGPEGTPVPTCFRQEYCEKILFLGSDRRTVKYIGRGSETADVVLLTTEQPLPAGCPKFYFEVLVVRAGVSCSITVGLIAYTRNGRRLGPAFTGVPEGVYYPAVGISSFAGVVRINCGQAPFTCDLTQSDEELRRAAKQGRMKELARRTEQAVNLMMMGYELPLCMYALRINHDDILLASEWIIGHPEHQVQDPDAECNQEVEDAEPHPAEEQPPGQGAPLAHEAPKPAADQPPSLDEDTLLLEAPDPQDVISSPFTEGDDPLGAAEAAAGPDGGSPEGQRARREREREQRIFMERALGGGALEAAQRGISLSHLYPGMVLAVKANPEGAEALEQLAHVSGLVLACDGITRRVLLHMYSPALALFAPQWLPSDALALSPVPAELCPGRSRQPVEAVCREVVQAYALLVTAQAQQCILSTLTHASNIIPRAHPMGREEALTAAAALAAAEGDLRGQMRALFASIRVAAADHLARHLHTPDAANQLRLRRPPTHPALIATRRIIRSLLQGPPETPAAAPTAAAAAAAVPAGSHTVGELLVEECLQALARYAREGCRIRNGRGAPGQGSADMYVRPSRGLVAAYDFALWVFTMLFTELPGALCAPPPAALKHGQPLVRTASQRAAAAPHPHLAQAAQAARLLIQCLALPYPARPSATCILLARLAPVLAGSFLQDEPTLARLVLLQHRLLHQAAPGERVAARAPLQTLAEFLTVVRFALHDARYPPSAATAATATLPSALAGPGAGACTIPEDLSLARVDHENPSFLMLLLEATEILRYQNASTDPALGGPAAPPPPWLIQQGADAYTAQRFLRHSARPLYAPTFVPRPKEHMREVVHIPGATKIVVRFQGKCGLVPGDWLCFSAEAAPGSDKWREVARRSAGADEWAPIEVPGERLLVTLFTEARHAHVCPTCRTAGPHWRCLTCKRDCCPTCACPWHFGGAPYTSAPSRTAKRGCLVVDVPRAPEGLDQALADLGASAQALPEQMPDPGAASSGRLCSVCSGPLAVAGPHDGPALVALCASCDVPYMVCPKCLRQEAHLHGHSPAHTFAIFPAEKLPRLLPALGLPLLRKALLPPQSLAGYVFTCTPAFPEPAPAPKPSAGADAPPPPPAGTPAPPEEARARQEALETAQLLRRGEAEAEMCRAVQQCPPEVLAKIDAELVALANAVPGLEIHKDPVAPECRYSDLLATGPSTPRGPRHPGGPPLAALVRFGVLQHLNRVLPKPMVAYAPLLGSLSGGLWQTYAWLDLTRLEEAGSLAAMVARHRQLIFTHTKTQLLDAILRATSTGGGRRKSVTVNRYRANKKTEAGSVFNQIFQQLRRCAPADLCSGRAWEVQFQGEGATDCGGPYSESVSHICQELQGVLPLLLPCSNGRQGVGLNRDKWVPSPACRDPHHMAQFEFLGALMGVAIRSREPLALYLPSIVWKFLIGQPRDLTDIEAIDRMSIQLLATLRRPQDQGLDASSFAEQVVDTFTVVSADGRVVPLKAGGAGQPVTWANRLEYAELLERYRLHEFDTQLQAIRNGLVRIVPPQVLALFLWQEMELRVCGQVNMDLDLLKRHTNIEGADNPELVRMFWAVLESFGPEERAGFLRFTWGRSRLPLTDGELTNHLSVQFIASERPDQYLPTASTCFFKVRIPRYSNIDRMREKLLYAIRECREVDNDHAVSSQEMQAAMAAAGEAEAPGRARTTTPTAPRLRTRTAPSCPATAGGAVSGGFFRDSEDPLGGPDPDGERDDEADPEDGGLRASMRRFAPRPAVARRAPRDRDEDDLEADEGGEGEDGGPEGGDLFM